MEISNNIFDYATKELSQDAFICWCVNWFNCSCKDSKEEKLKKMAVEIVKKLSGEDKIDSVKVIRQFSRTVKINNKKTYIKIDVLLIVNKTLAVIIEDKTYTGEHDQQIRRYEKGLEKLIEQETDKSSVLYGIKDIKTVFLKTGFISDDDKRVSAKLGLYSDKLLEILEKYENCNYILDSYISHLKKVIDFRKEQSEYRENNPPESFWDWKISKSSIAQHALMRDIFPEALWNGESEIYKVYQGYNKSSDRPWTEMLIFKEMPVSIFWRIDTDAKGPYISLRLHENFDKKDSQRAAKHEKLYEKLLEISENIINADDDYIETVTNKGKFKESDFIHIFMAEPLKDWENNKEKICKSVNFITDEFLKKLKNIDINEF